MSKGKVIVIDGMDGCGKHTQTLRLLEYMLRNGYKVAMADFPNYESDSSGPVKMYLNGDMGRSPSEINPYSASLFYSVDRFITFNTKKLFELYNSGWIILLDRYISANIIYQSSKFKDKKDREDFYKWLYEIECNKMGLPVDDITIAMTLPLEVSQKLMLERYNGHSEKKDIHESDLKFLAEVRKNLEEACVYLSSIGYNWVNFDCSKDGYIDTEENIQDRLIEIIKPIIDS